MISNLFGIHSIIASKVIYGVCVAVAKHLGSKSVWLAPFVIRETSLVHTSHYVPKNPWND